MKISQLSRSKNIIFEVVLKHIIQNILNKIQNRKVTCFISCCPLTSSHSLPPFLVFHLSQQTAFLDLREQHSWKAPRMTVNSLNAGPPVFSTLNLNNRNKVYKT
jgi:hypothetical protein